MSTTDILGKKVSAKEIYNNRTRQLDVSSWFVRFSTCPCRLSGLNFFKHFNLNFPADPVHQPVLYDCDQHALAVSSVDTLWLSNIIYDLF